MMTVANESSFATATRIVAADDGTNYDNVAISLHWATAVLVVIQFALAETWDWFSKDTRETMQSIHVSFGMLLAAVVATRIIWRLIPGHQKSSLEVGWVRLASKGVHYLLYLLLIGQAVLGFLIGWSAGHPIHFFGLGIPGPFGALDRGTRHELREIHEKVGWAIIIIALGHSMAALYHHYRLHDRVLQRMAPWVARSAP